MTSERLERPARAEDTILPLPLTPFEDYMLADDRPAYPMEFFVRLRFTGRFDRAALDSAFSTALTRHPLLRAVVRQHGRRRYWEAAQTLPAIQWSDGKPAEVLPNLGPVDVRSGPSTRVVVLAEPGRTDLILQVHHACTDGLGSLRFLEDVLISYAQVRDLVPNAAPPSLDLEQLRHRGRLGRSPRMWPRILAQQLTALPRICRFLMKQCEPLVEPSGGAGCGDRPEDYPVSLTHRLTRTETASVIAACREHGVTVNDLLATEFLRSLKRAREGNDSDRWLRACVPVNIRTVHPDRVSAANTVSYVFLNRLVGDLDDSRRLLASIHDEMDRAKRLNTALIFVLWLGLCRKVPGLLNRLCHRDSCMATGVVSNLGQVFLRSPLADDQGRMTLGDVALESVEMLSTWRPLTSVAIAALTYAGRLSVTLHYDPRALSAEQAAEFMEGFTADVSQFAA